MRRRDISKILLATATTSGAGVIAQKAEAQSCTAPCYAQTADELAASVTPTNYAYEPGNFRRYGAVVNGSTDDSAAIRAALNAVPLSGGRVFCWPPGPIKVASTVYIPQRTSASSGTGIDLDLTGCTLIGNGQGSGEIFESGTGNTSSATNFGQVSESAAAIHSHTRIRGATFAYTGTAIRLFNFLKGCKLEDLYFEAVDTAVYTLRSFYLELHNCAAVVQSITAGRILFNFDGLCNAMKVIGCTAAGGAGNTTGVGFQFLVGASILFDGCTAEGLDRGLLLAATIQGMEIKSCYFEGLTTAAIDASGSGTKTMDIGNCYFNGTTKAITAAQWIQGLWANSNTLTTNDLIEILDDLSNCIIEIPQQPFSEDTATASAPRVPSNYHLTNSVILRAPRLVYAASLGPVAALAIDGAGNLGSPVFAYSGGAPSSGAGYWLPFVTQTNSTGSSTLDTQIAWSPFRMEVVFDLYGDFNGGNVRLYGFVFSAGNILRADGNSAAWTVTASNQGGNLRLTIGGTGLSGRAMAGWLGQIRHI
jgi:hypothetical protein